jgi:hypothetical protein
MNAKRNISVILIVALIVGLASSATATILPRIEFEPIGPVTVDIEDIDLFALIMEGDPGQAVFEFHNENLISSSVASICFEDYGLDRVDDIQSVNDGIFFKKDKNPANFPGGGALEPNFDTAFSIGATPPPVWHGIRPGEQLTVTVDLDPEITYSDILARLDEGSVRIGMHVIGLSDGSSFSAVNKAEIPEPVTISLLGMGTLFLFRNHKK